MLSKYSSIEKYPFYDGPLGSFYRKEKTLFRLWAPSADIVKVKLSYRANNFKEDFFDIGVFEMNKLPQGIFELTLEGDYKNIFYTYLITIDGISRETVDIYAKATGINGNKAMILDLESTNPPHWEKDNYIGPSSPTEAIIWEAHVKDFSFDQNSGIEAPYRGKYLAFTEKNTTLRGEGNINTGLSYLKDLGITHVHLLPVFDFASLEEITTDIEAFNWGYEPKNYNVPEGSFSTNPFDGNVRIREFKEMVKALHEENIGVIMDVVYNHTYEASNSWFNLTVPNYYYRQDPKGLFSNGSGCGNETASERAMCRKYIIDSILYWATEYHIDGFRFDLMALHDTETMNLVRAALDSLPHGKKLLIYGEPWTGGESNLKAPFKEANKENVQLLDDRIAAFNDNFRDAIPGRILSSWDKNNKGFLQGADFGEAPVKSGITANVLLKDTPLMLPNPWAKSPSQVVTYISAHDNLTFYDKLVLSERNGEYYGEYYEDLVALNKLAAAIYITSQGIIFMQAGEEFGRSKGGNHNSYNSKASINKINWENLEKFKTLNDYYKGLIKIRKAYSPFMDSSTLSISKIKFQENLPPHVLGYTIDNVLAPQEEWNTLALYFNSLKESCFIELPKKENQRVEWVLIVDENHAGTEALKIIRDTTIELPGKAAMILVDRTSFEKRNALL